MVVQMKSWRQRLGLTIGSATIRSLWIISRCAGLLVHFLVEAHRAPRRQGWLTVSSLPPAFACLKSGS